MKGYILNFIIGGILLCLIHYFSQKKESKLCALIPALPVLGLIGLFYISKTGKSEVVNYLRNIIIFFILYVFLFCGIYLSYSNTDMILASTILCLILWAFVIFNFVI